MKYFRKILFLVPFLLLTNCQANWEFNLVVNEGGGGNYTISILIDQEAQQYAEENGIMHIETSAKNDTNVKSLFHEIGTYGLSIKAHISGGVAQKLPSHAPQSDREAFPLIPCVPTRVDVFLA